MAWKRKEMKPIFILLLILSVGSFLKTIYMLLASHYYNALSVYLHPVAVSPQYFFLMSVLFSVCAYYIYKSKHIDDSDLTNKKLPKSRKAKQMKQDT